MVPPETTQLEVFTELPEIKQAVSLTEKPDPVTLTVDPAGAEAGLSTIEGVLVAVVWPGVV
jgi:hypothetical protein